MLIANVAGRALASAVAPVAAYVGNECGAENLAPCLEAAAVEDAEEIGLAENPAVDEETPAEVGHAASSSTDVGPPPPPPAPSHRSDAEEPLLMERHGIVGPSPLGYLNMSGRCFLRIQRGTQRASYQSGAIRTRGSAFCCHCAWRPRTRSSSNGAWKLLLQSQGRQQPTRGLLQKSTCAWLRGGARRLGRRPQRKLPNMQRCIAGFNGGGGLVRTHKIGALVSAIIYDKHIGRITYYV